MVNSPYNLALEIELQATVWYSQHRFEEARSEALRSLDVYNKIGAAEGVERCEKLLQDIERKLNTPISSDQSGFNCEFP